MTGNCINSHWCNGGDRGLNNFSFFLFILFFINIKKRKLYLKNTKKNTQWVWHDIHSIII